MSNAKYDWIQKKVDNALQNWGEADYEWSQDPTNEVLEYQAERMRKRYLQTCYAYGVEPVEGAVREF